MQTLRIDINCDVGEGVGNEEFLFPFISSCNIACGGHCGDNASMQRTIVLAKENSVKIGAHPSYPDKDNFGRKSITISNKDLIDSIDAQLGSFETVLKEVHGGQLHHIKPHGALYNDIAKDINLADIFLKSISKYKSKTYLYVPYASVISKLAVEQGFQTKIEAFVDRNYNSDYSLVSRNKPNAVIGSNEKILENLLRMTKENKIISITEKELKLKADTFCIHGDNPNALHIMEYLSKELPKHNITIH